MNQVRNDAKWKEVTDISVLENVECKPLGPRHQPVKHYEAAEMFKNILDKSGISVTTTKGLLSPDGLKYVHTERISNDEGGWEYMVGFVNYNNKAKSFQMFAGEHVMVCSNECYGGIIQESVRRHTTNILGETLYQKLQNGVEYFLKFREKYVTKLNFYKQLPMTEEMLGKVIVDLCRNAYMGANNIRRIVQEYDNPSFDYGVDKNSVWSFRNAATHIFKNVESPITRIGLSDTLDKALYNALPQLPRYTLDKEFEKIENKVLV